jgi:hypothetical protein
VRREVIAARGVVTILLIFNSLLYDHVNAINFQINESHVQGSTPFLSSPELNHLIRDSIWSL